MEVRTYGISIDTESEHVSVNNLFAHLCDDLQIKNEGEHNERRFYVNNEDDNYYKGLVVTVKDQKAFCKLQEENDGRITIQVENLDERNRLMDFNFFVINKTNGLGLYQHYHQSCGVSTFGGFLKSFHKEMRDKLVQEEFDDEGESLTEEKRKEIRGKYRDALHFSLLTRPEDLDKILNELHEIGAFHYEYSTLEVIKNDGVPLNGFVKKKVEKVSFIDTADKAALIKAILSHIDIFKLQKGSVIGKDESGENKNIKIVDMPEHFGLENFDSVAEKLNHLDISEFHTHQIINELLVVCRDNSHIFEAKVEQ